MVIVVKFTNSNVSTTRGLRFKTKMRLKALGIGTSNTYLGTIVF